MKWFSNFKTAAVIEGILSWPNVLFQIPVLYTCPPKVSFSISMWKTWYFHEITIQALWKHLVLLQIFIFEVKCLWRYQICIFVDLSDIFKSSQDRVINSCSMYCKWINCTSREVFSWTHKLLQMPGIYILI